ncbi:MAG TPA: hypothetical protein VEH86_00660 [Candidatus Acidoferrum sp.]|nr:hypothetical protein [Candidatus Acidoferrum sp.]
MKNLMHVSARKLVAVLCIVAVSAVSVAFAAVRFTSVGPNVISNAITADENLADKVTIYGNGVTFVQYQMTTELENGTHDIQFYLPSGALTGTLTVSGVNVVTIATSEESQPIIERGDVITVYTDDGTYTGEFLSWDSMLLLEADNGTIMIPTARITRIVLSEVVQVQGPKILADVTTDSPSGEYELNVSYLMRGPQWNPTYFVDLDTSHLECWATIENVESWSNFSLVLVSGGPHLVYNGPFDGTLVYSEQGLSPQFAASIDFTSSTTDEYHEYAYDGKLTFEAGTTVKLPLFNGTVGLRQEYFWSGGEVENRYHLNDTLDEPLAGGTVEFYRGNVWIGEDSIGYTPVNAESIAIVNYADDIQVVATVTKLVMQSNYEDQGTNITITNYKPTSVQVLIQQDIDGYDLVSSTPSATRTGSVLSWIMNVEPNASATMYYEWDHSW